jgi:NlpC/P60 family putative phage cell wall peptidase
MSNSPITADSVVAEARSWIGTPYQHQASLKGVGCDCLGLVRGVWRATIGAEPEPMPPYAPDWAEAASGEPLVEAALRHLVAMTASTNVVARLSAVDQESNNVCCKFRGVAAPSAGS